MDVLAEMLSFRRIVIELKHKKYIFFADSRLGVMFTKNRSYDTLFHWTSNTPHSNDYLYI